MDLTRNQIIEFFTALSALRGEPTTSLNERGQKETVFVPYPLSDRARWIAAHDRHILKQHVIANDEAMADKKAVINAKKKELLRAVRKEEDPKVQAKKMQEAQDAIQDMVDEANESARTQGKELIKVDGLRKIPAKGLCLKSSNLPPTIISELLPLIEGEPQFAEEPKE